MARLIVVFFKRERLKGFVDGFSFMLIFINMCHNNFLAIFGFPFFRSHFMNNVYKFLTKKSLIPSEFSIF